MAVRPRPIDFIKDMTASSVLRPGRIIAVLSTAYPSSVSAKNLMSEVGLPWQDQPVTSFASLCFDFSNINRGLRSYGWQAKRNGTTPDSLYSLSPQGAG